VGHFGSGPNGNRGQLKPSGALFSGQRLRSATSTDAGRRKAMTLSPGHHAARTPGASMALTPSTTHGGHPGWRGAPVATTMASSVRCSRSISCSSSVRRRAFVTRVSIRAASGAIPFFLAHIPSPSQCICMWCIFQWLKMCHGYSNVPLGHAGFALYSA
jgi:hypothetical protein